MDVRFAMLRNQILDFKESRIQMESLLGAIIHEYTDHLEGPILGIVTRTVIDGLRLASDKFDAEWELQKQE